MTRPAWQEDDGMPVSPDEWARWGLVHGVTQHARLAQRAQSLQQRGRVVTLLRVRPFVLTRVDVKLARKAALVVGEERKFEQVFHGQFSVLSSEFCVRSRQLGTQNSELRTQRNFGSRFSTQAS